MNMTADEKAVIDALAKSNAVRSYGWLRRASGLGERQLSKALSGLTTAGFIDKISGLGRAQFGLTTAGARAASDKRTEEPK